MSCRFIPDHSLPLGLVFLSLCSTSFRFVPFCFVVSRLVMTTGTLASPSRGLRGSGGDFSYDRHVGDSLDQESDSKGGRWPRGEYNPINTAVFGCGGCWGEQCGAFHV